MILLCILLSVYILAVNFYAFRLLKIQRDGFEGGRLKAGEGDGKLLLAAALGGAIAVYASMFVLRYRMESCVLMLALPLLAVLNVYCFYLGFRGICLVW